MINLLYTNGSILVYNVQDWAELRKTHRIIGEFLGSTGFVPSLPLKLQLEEAVLLQENRIAIIVASTRTHCNQEEYTAFASDLLKLEQVEYKRIRRAQLEELIDKIVVNRRKNGDERQPDDILEDELVKSSAVTQDNIIWPVFLEPLGKPTKLQEISPEVLLSSTSRSKCRIFRDLWEKGYYVTQGQKFGGDFLVYLGDPLVYHAIFIVRCIDCDKTVFPSEIVAFGRLGTSVKKRAVLASVKGEKVCYLTINWIDS